MAAKSKKTADSEYVEKRRKRQAENSRAKFAAASDIGEIPAPKHLGRRLLCRCDLHLFSQWYFPGSAGLAPFGSGHRKALDRMQSAILHGGLVLNCLPRGYAKSTLSEIALIWAVLYGHRRYGVLFSASSEEATESLASIKSELQENDRLHEDFPEVCIPIRALEGRSQRCQTQTHQGRLTQLRWTAGDIVLASIPGSSASGGIIRAKGIMSASRGLKFKRPDGQQARPDLGIIDDPQTDESAESPAQISKRLKILRKSILRGGGHGKELSAIMNGTVIADDDLVDQLADHKRHPEWLAIRVKMVQSMPLALETHWLKEYRRLRHDYDPDVDGDQQRAKRAATQYYVENREVMDEHAAVSWQHIPLEAGEVSAIQHAMNILIDHGEDSFATECQNEPKRVIPSGVSTIDRDEALQRRSGYGQFVVPNSAARLVAHCDVHDAILYWSVAAVANDFTGYVIDYGTYPEQPSPSFTMKSVKRPLKDATGAESAEEAIVAGVKHVIDSLGGRIWVTPGGEAFPISSLLVDVGYKPEEVARAVRLSEYAGICWGSRGIGIGPIQKPMPEYDTSPTRMRRAGPIPNAPRWFEPKTTTSGLREIRFDANYWKSIVAARLGQAAGTPGSWTFWGNERVDHGPYVDHLAAEEPVPVSARGRTVNVWNVRPNRENHWWDTLVGCGVAASLIGIQVPGTAHAPPQRPRRRRRRRKIEVVG